MRWIATLSFVSALERVPFNCLSEKKTFKVGVYFRKDFIEALEEEDRSVEDGEKIMKDIIEDKMTYWLDAQFNIRLSVRAFVRRDTAKDAVIAQKFEDIEYDVDSTAPPSLGKDGDQLLEESEQMALWFIMYRKSSERGTLAWALPKTLGQNNGIEAIGWFPNKDLSFEKYTLKLAHTMTHEFGHILGLKHEKDGSKDSIMYYAFNSSIPLLDYAFDPAGKFNKTTIDAKSEVCDTLKNVGPEIEVGNNGDNVAATSPPGGSNVAATSPPGGSNVPETSPPGSNVPETSPPEGSSNTPTTTSTLEDDDSDHLWPFLVAGGVLLLCIVLVAVYAYSVKKPEPPPPVPENNKPAAFNPKRKKEEHVGLHLVGQKHYPGAVKRPQKRNTEISLPSSTKQKMKKKKMKKKNNRRSQH